MTTIPNNRIEVIPITALIEDTRQKVGQHDLKNAQWRDHRVTVVRCKLPYGDYIVAPRIAVDTKKDIQELCMDIGAEHNRFRRECELAQACGATLVILVENDDGVTDLDALEKWRENDESFKKRRGKRRYMGKRFAESCRTMGERYGVRFEFCKPEESARRVVQILKGL